MKVKQFEHANQFLITDNDCLYLQSYDSLVVKIDGTTITFYPHWDYSNTTMRHVKHFLEMYTSIPDVCAKTIRKMISKGSYGQMYTIIYEEDYNYAD